MTKYRLKKLRNLNNEEMNVKNYVLNNLHKEKKKTNIIYVTVSAIVSIAIFVLMINVLDQSPQLNQSTNHGTPALDDEEVFNKIEELSTIWANALETRDGKPRYEMMSEKAKEKFKKEQITRSGEDWNFNIGVSSPWVVDFVVQIEGMNATITYLTQTSEPAYYNMRDTLTFINENGKLWVDDFQSIEANNKNGLYIGHISIGKDTLYLDEVEWITDENQDRINELELSPADMPNGFYIDNPSTDKILFKIGDNTEYNFVTLEALSFYKEGADRNYSTTKKEEFMEFLNNMNTDRIVFWVEVKDGFVVTITEQFIN